MKSSVAFPTENLKAEDLTGDLTLTVKNVVVEKIGEDTKPIMSFAETVKRLVINKTNWLACAEIFGDESDDWHGKKITLYKTRVDYAGKQVPAIRIKAAKNGHAGSLPTPANRPISGMTLGGAWAAYKRSERHVQATEAELKEWFKRDCEHYFGAPFDHRIITPEQWALFAAHDFLPLPPNPFEEAPAPAYDPGGEIPF